MFERQSNAAAVSLFSSERQRIGKLIKRSLTRPSIRDATGSAAAEDGDSGAKRRHPA